MKRAVSIPVVDPFGVAGDLLEELGYSRGAPHPGSEAFRTTSLVRDSFVRELLAGGDRPPGSWKR
jgi:hypothetical protein